MQLLKASGVQFPASIGTTDGFVRSVSHPLSKVKTKIKNVTETKQFKRWFGDWQKHPERIPSALLNEDGTPKVFYHGTNEIFTVFSPDELNPREGSYFFAENIEDARGYGGNVYEVYLSADKLADYDNQPSEFYKLKSKREQVEYLKAKGYDGWYSDMDSGGWGEVSVFSNTQIKSTTDNIGTFDGSNSDIRYSRKKSTSGENYVQIDENAIDLQNGKSIAQNIAEILHDKFNNLIITNGQYIRVNADTNREFRESNWAKALRKENISWYNDKIKSLANADEILSVAKNWVNENIKHERKDKITSFGRGNILYKVGKNGYSADVLVGVKDDGSAVLYDIINISDKKTAENPTVLGNDNSRAVLDVSADNDSTTLAPESQEKTQNSLKTGRSATYHAYEIMDLFGIKQNAENRNVIADTLERLIGAIRDGGDYINDEAIRRFARDTADYILPEVKKKRGSGALT